MVRTPSCDKSGLRKGTWTPEEDSKLIAYVTRYGSWNWRQLPRFAGLARCGKSCRLRWMNYLRPNLKRGNFTRDEEDTIIRLHNKLGNRWSAIAAQLPGRTDNEIKNHWHTSLKKRFQQGEGATSDTRGTAATNYSQISETTISSNSAPLSPISSSSSITNCSDHRSSKGNWNPTVEEFDELAFLDGSFWTEAYDLADILNSSSSGPSDEAIVPTNKGDDNSNVLFDAAAPQDMSFDDVSFLDLDNEFGRLLDEEQQAAMIDENACLSSHQQPHAHHVPDDVSHVPAELFLVTSPPPYDYLSFSPLSGGGPDLWSTSPTNFMYQDQQHQHHLSLF